MPPSAIGLFCLQFAQQGGLSRVVSLCTVHNELRRCHPDLLARLYRPFWWDRQAEHAWTTCVSVVIRCTSTTATRLWHGITTIICAMVPGLQARHLIPRGQRLWQPCEPSWMPPRMGWNSVSSRDSSTSTTVSSPTPAPPLARRQACGHRVTCCGSGTAMKAHRTLKGKWTRYKEIAPWIYKLWCTRP